MRPEFTLIEIKAALMGSLRTWRGGPLTRCELWQMVGGGVRPAHLRTAIDALVGDGVLECAGGEPERYRMCGHLQEVL